jgi:hypothetical protein
MNKPERIDQLRDQIGRELISEANGARPQLDDDGHTIVHTATCGTCSMAWNDALITGRTPAPGARCPYEYIHRDLAEFARLTKGRRYAILHGKLHPLVPRMVKVDGTGPEVRIDHLMGRDFAKLAFLLTANDDTGKPHHIGFYGDTQEAAIEDVTKAGFSDARGISQYASISTIKNL